MTIAAAAPFDEDAPARRAGEFRKGLEELINRNSMENGSDTPDHILASYLASCLFAFDLAVQGRETWYGRGPEKLPPSPAPDFRGPPVTKTFATTNIVIMPDGAVYAEDHSFDSSRDVVSNRLGPFLKENHVRFFPHMRGFTEWLQEVGAIVDRCTILSDHLSEAERRA